MSDRFAASLSSDQTSLIMPHGVSGVAWAFQCVPVTARKSIGTASVAANPLSGHDVRALRYKVVRLLLLLMGDHDV